MMPWQQSERRRFRRHLHSSKSAHERTKAENRRCWRPSSAFPAGGWYADTPPKRFLGGRRAVSPDVPSIPPAARSAPSAPRGCAEGLPTRATRRAFHGPPGPMWTTHAAPIEQTGDMSSQAASGEGGEKNQDRLTPASVKGY